MARGRRERAVLAGGDTSQLAELPVEMRLVAVARLQREVGERRRSWRRRAVEHAPEAQHAGVSLGREPDRLAEERDEAPMAVAAALDQRADALARAQTGESFGDPRMDSADARQPLGQDALEESQPIAIGAGNRQPLLDLAHAGAP